MPKERSKISSTKVMFEDERNNILGELLDLEDEELERMKKRLKKEISDWKTNTSGQKRKLERWNDLSEGVVEETNYPYEGASQIHIPIISIYLDIYHNIECRSIIDPEKIWYADTSDEMLIHMAPKVDEMMNDKAANEWNVKEALRDVFCTTNRDGLGVLQVPMVEEYEDMDDEVLVENIQQFIEEFPSAEDCGISSEEYQSLGERVAEEASVETPMRISVNYEKLKYFGPKGEVVELADFVIFPATARDISAEYARGYGKRFTMRKGQVKQAGEDGKFYRESVDRFLKSKKTGSQPNHYVASKDLIEGLNRSGKNEEYEFYELVYRFKDKKTKKEKKFLIVYTQEENIIMGAKKYPYRIDFYALFRIKKRPNRLIGWCVPEILEDLNEEIDVQHRQRINSRTIASVPSFKAQKSAQGDFDPAALENQWRPGVIFWLSDFSAFEQFKVQPVDMGESMKEEQNDMMIASMRTGVDPSLFSGQAQAVNPQGGFNKVQSLIQQSNLRMDDVLSELREGVEQVGQICMSHLYQFGPSQIQFNPSKQQSGVVNNINSNFIPKRILRKGFKIKMHSTNVIYNAESEFNKWMNIYAILSKEPLIAKNGLKRMGILRKAFESGRIQGWEKLLPNDQEVQKQEQQMQKIQMMQLQIQTMLAQAKLKNLDASSAEKISKVQKNKADTSIKAVKTVGDLVNHANRNGKTGEPAVI